MACPSTTVTKIQQGTWWLVHPQFPFLHATSELHPHRISFSTCPEYLSSTRWTSELLSLFANQILNVLINVWTVPYGGQGNVHRTSTIITEGCPHTQTEVSTARLFLRHTLLVAILMLPSGLNIEGGYAASSQRSTSVRSSSHWLAIRPITLAYIASWSMTAVSPTFTAFFVSESVMVCCLIEL